ncbi:hypothetical protein F5X97DRAFT_319658 [Nemania serpens]|nr:hypothetical protein F5X97DRAFT_319658 [Nemania serpens]
MVSPAVGQDTPLCSGELQLDMTNPATNYTIKCRLDGPQLAPGPLSKDSGGARRGDTTPSTQTCLPVSSPWSPPTVLHVNEAFLGHFSCSQPRSGIAFKGAAEARLDSMNCTGSTSDSLVKECAAPDMRARIYQYWRDDLPPYALERPIPILTPTLDPVSVL